MKQFQIYIAILLACLTVVPANAKKKKDPYRIPANYEIQEIGVGKEGTKVFKIWCYGKKPEDAIKEAKRAAVAACIFRGLSNTPALCADPTTAQETYKDFFADFFDEDGGAYIQFINLSTDGMPSGQDRLKTSKGYKIGIKVQVMHANLREYLETKNIIKKLTDGFY
ncbi:hypothetical protein [Bacteroides sp.]